MERPTGQAVATGVSAAAIGYASSVAVVIAGLTAAGATPGQVSSALVGLGVLMALGSVALSARLRIPVAVVWSTPGLALLVTVGPLDGGFALTVGAFLVAAALIVLTGLIRPVTRLVGRLPLPLTAAVLAGVLLPFCLQPARGVVDLPLQAGAIAVVWLLASRVAPRWSAPAALLALVVVVLLAGDLPPLGGAPLGLELVSPRFSWDAVVRVAVPLYLVTMAGQNLVGLSVLKAEGYDPPTGTLLVGTGLASAAGAPFGAPTVNLAAITGALTAGPTAGPDPALRWPAAATGGLTYLALAAVAPLAAAVVTGVDPRLVGTAAGLALVGALAASASNALREDATRIPALLTLLVTASGIQGGPALGLLVGLVALRVLRVSPPTAERPGRRRRPQH